MIQAMKNLLIRLTIWAGSILEREIFLQSSIIWQKKLFPQKNLASPRRR